MRRERRILARINDAENRRLYWRLGAVAFAIYVALVWLMSK